MRLDLRTLAFCLPLAACGHPATASECDEIVDKIVRLELAKVYGNSPDELKAKTAATKRNLRQTTLKECVGKRITTKAMQCVRTAKTSEQILDECLPFTPR